MNDKEIDKFFEDAPTIEESEALSASIDYDVSRDPVAIADLCKAEISGDLRRAMKEARISQSALGTQIDVSRQYIHQILGEAHNFTIDTMAKLSAALNRRLIVKMLGEEEAMPVVPSSMLPDVRRMIHGGSTKTESGLKLALMAAHSGHFRTGGGPDAVASTELPGIVLSQTSVKLAMNPEVELSSTKNWIASKGT